MVTLSGGISPLAVKDMVDTLTVNVVTVNDEILKFLGKVR